MATRSHAAQNCNWLVKNIRVLPASRERKHWSKTSLPTWASIAESGSSRTITSARLYAARAMATRCFWPPEIVMPRSPISVPSPAGNCSKSSARQHARRTLWYHASSISEPNRMFSRTVEFKICGDCVT
mmetsp:Transcript_14646/g.43529  ORF Transcript_14646/g.43529 Transcript_14646/m.43529 type:complete len:129 (-) Transcript_14646:1293-1679(-)